MQRLGRAGVGDLLGPRPVHAGERPFHGADDVGDRDLVRRAAKPKSALRTALAGHEAARLELMEDVLEEVSGISFASASRSALTGASPSSAASVTAARTA
jgi:hypothetical protein